MHSSQVRNEAALLVLNAPRGLSASSSSAARRGKRAMAESGSEAEPTSSQPDPEVQQLEQLADQIQAEAAEAEQHAQDDGTAAATAAAAAEQQLPAAEPQTGQPLAGSRATAPANDSGKLVHQCWEEAVDLNSGQRYWFNRATVRPDWLQLLDRRLCPWLLAFRILALLQCHHSFQPCHAHCRA